MGIYLKRIASSSVSQHACAGAVSPLAAGLSGLGILSTMSASCPTSFKSGEGKQCRESEGGVEDDGSGLSQPGGRSALVTRLSMKNLLFGLEGWSTFLSL